MKSVLNGVFMQAIIEFINSNYQLLILIGSGVIEFILLLICKKRSFIVDTGATQILVELVIKAERIYGHGHGKEKLNYVISQYFLMYPDKVKIPEYRDALIYCVESILDTPQKK